MKPLPDELQFGPEMVLSVALEMEEKRRLMSASKTDADDDGSEDADDDDDQVSIL
jgi:hypothetical protein